jgi:Protein of unknown function (DUF2946)
MRSWGRRIGTTLGIIAVAVSLYLPIHIARDIVGAAMDAIAAAEASTFCHSAPAIADAGSSGVTVPYRHNGGSHHHHDNTCPICGSVSTAAAAILLPTPVPLAEPKALALPVRFERSVLARAAEIHTPYAPRAPPRSA